MAKPQDMNDAVVPYDTVELEAVRSALLGQGRLEVRDEDPDAVTARIVNRILEGTADEAFTPQTVVKGKELVNVGFRLEAVDWASSDFEEGPGVFAIGTAALLEDTFAGSRGDVVKISLGGAQVVAQLYKAVTADTLPRDLVIRQTDKPTKRGYYPKWLEDFAPKVAA